MAFGSGVGQDGLIITIAFGGAGCGGSCGCCWGGENGVGEAWDETER